jgi:threonine synthase
MRPSCRRSCRWRALGGVFAEPAGATAYAGLLQAWYDGLVKADETIVVINTGSGLKDVARGDGGDGRSAGDCADAGGGARGVGAIIT